MGSGCGCLIADCSFVCQTTPHFGSTSRKASYSVWGYLTPNFPICKVLSFIFYRLPHFPSVILSESQRDESKDPFPKEYGFFDSVSSMPKLLSACPRQAGI